MPADMASELNAPINPTAVELRWNSATQSVRLDAPATIDPASM